MTANNVINTTIPFTVAKGGTGQTSLTDHQILVGQGSSALASVGLSAGQVLVGTTSSDPVGATITGTGVTTVTSASGSISISSPAGGLAWSVITSGTTAVVAGNGYFSNGTTLAFTLPATSSIGDTFSIININGASGFIINTEGGGRTIEYGGTAYSTSLASPTVPLLGSTVTLVCATAGSSGAWYVSSSIGVLLGT